MQGREQTACRCYARNIDGHLIEVLPVSAVATSQSIGRTRRVFRNTSAAWRRAWFSLLGAAWCARWAYDFPEIGAKALFALLALVAVVWSPLQLRPAIIVSGDEVTVRGWIRTRTESWSNVAGFGFAQPNPVFRFAVYIVVMLNDGSRLHTYGLTTSDEGSKFAVRTVAAMEALRPI